MIASYEINVFDFILRSWGTKSEYHIFPSSHPDLLYTHDSKVATQKSKDLYE